MSWPSNYNRERFKHIECYCLDFEINSIKRCLEDMDYQDNFPEDMCESRTDWDELKDRLYSAHHTVDHLLNIIERLTEK